MKHNAALKSVLGFMMSELGRVARVETPLMDSFNDLSLAIVNAVLISRLEH